MKVEIINIGDELLIGQVVNTNAAWMGAELKLRGWDLVQVTVVADKLEDIINSYDAALKRADVVLVTGGIGPTKDDVTRTSFLKYFDVDLVYNADVYATIERLFSTRSIKMNDLTRDQAMVPSNAIVLQNEVGTAPCCWYEKDGKVIVSMPGVPSEMKWLMNNAVMPRLQDRFKEDSHIISSILMVRDYSESALAEALSEVESEMPSALSLAYLPQPGIIRLRLTAKGKDEDVLRKQLEETVEKIKYVVAEKVFSEEDDTVAATVLKRLAEKGYTLSTAESCTGGTIASLITAVPGSSEYYKGSVVSYANEVKQSVLGVAAEDLEKQGAVSEPVVLQMVEGVAKLCNTTCALSTSGIAGPSGGTAEKPVGTVWIAAKVGETRFARCYTFGKVREYNMMRASNAALLLLLELIEKQ